MIVLRAVKWYTSCTSIEQTLFKQIVTRDKVLDLVHLFLLKKLLCICTVGFCDKHLLDLHRVDEVKNFAVNNLLSWCFEVVYWDPHNCLSRTWEPCIRKGNCYYRTSLIGYWNKGSTVGW